MGKLRMIFRAMGTMAIMGMAIGPASADSQYRVIRTEGNTAVALAGGTHVSAVSKGLPIDVGDRLVTGADGRLEIMSPSGTVIALEKNTVMKVGQADDGASSFFLKVGRLLARFKPVSAGQAGYRVSTPVAVAAVRGTELAVDVKENGATEAGVVEGTVDFDGPDNPEDDTAVAPVAATGSSFDVDSSTESDESSDEMRVTGGGGVQVDPNRPAKKLSRIPPVLVASLDWFPKLREEIPSLQASLEPFDSATRASLRADALRQRVLWNVPEDRLHEIPLPSKTPRPNPARLHPDSVRPDRQNPRPPSP